MDTLKDKNRIIGLVLLAGIQTAVGAGCGNRSAEVRNYREIQVVPETPPPPMSPHGAPRPTMAAPRPQGGGFAWDAPKGWDESPGSGMRLASFAMKQDGAEGLCTVVTLSGPAGGLESNVVRWLGQLELPVPEGAGLKTFLDAQDRFETDSGLPVVFVDIMPLTRAQGTRPDSMLIGVITVGQQTAFLKLTGKMELLEQERENLRALCRSFRAQS